MLCFSCNPLFQGIGIFLFPNALVTNVNCLMAYFNTADLTPAELEDLAFLRARRAGINEDVEVVRVF